MQTGQKNLFTDNDQSSVDDKNKYVNHINQNVAKPDNKIRKNDIYLVILWCNEITDEIHFYGSIPLGTKTSEIYLYGYRIEYNK